MLISEPCWVGSCSESRNLSSSTSIAPVNTRSQSSLCSPSWASSRTESALQDLEVSLSRTSRKVRRRPNALDIQHGTCPAFRLFIVTFHLFISASGTCKAGPLAGRFSRRLPEFSRTDIRRAVIHDVEDLSWRQKDRHSRPRHDMNRFCIFWPLPKFLSPIPKFLSPLLPARAFPSSLVSSNGRSWFPAQPDKAQPGTVQSRSLLYWQITTSTSRMRTSPVRSQHDFLVLVCLHLCC